MKNLTFTFILLIAFSCSTISAGNTGGHNDFCYNYAPCIFTPHKDRPTNTRSAFNTPVVYYNQSSLLFEDEHPDYYLTIIKNGDVIFQTNIEENCKKFMFPTDMAGNYEFIIYIGDIAYSANINL